MQTLSERKAKSKVKNPPTKQSNNGHNLTTHMLHCLGVEPSTLSRNICVVGCVSHNKPVRKAVKCSFSADALCQEYCGARYSHDRETSNNNFIHAKFEVLLVIVFWQLTPCRPLNTW